ncbi:MAG: hypothetical protein FWD66_02350 [Paludibacter sp.]|nr:hypothetical protein [Paludibacter sp.]
MKLRQFQKVISRTVEPRENAGLSLFEITGSRRPHKADSYKSAFLL